MVAVDTNFLIRLIIGEPQDQADQAQEIYDRAAARSLLVDRLVIAETLYVLRSNYELSRPKSIELLTSLLRNKTFNFIDEDICNGMLSLMTSSNLSPEDACLVALVHSGRAASVATFDAGLLKHLAKN